MRVLVGLGATREQAEDAAQNAALRAWRHRHRFRAGSDPRPWVLTIARRELLRLLARPHHSREIVSVDARTCEADSESTDSIVDRLDLRAALSTLAAHERVLLGLRYERDLTQPEVAEILDLPEGTAKVRLHRARGKVRALLGADGDG